MAPSTRSSLCLLLAALQGVVLADNTSSVNLIASGSFDTPGASAFALADGWQALNPWRWVTVGLESGRKYAPTFGTPGTYPLTLSCTVTYSETINSTDPDSSSPTGTIVTPTVYNGATVTGSVGVTVAAVNPVVTIGSASAPGGTQDVAVTPSNGAGDLEASVTNVPDGASEKWAWTVVGTIYSPTGYPGTFGSDGTTLSAQPKDDDTTASAWLVGTFNSVGQYETEVTASVSLTESGVTAGPFTSKPSYIGGDDFGGGSSGLAVRAGGGVRPADDGPQPVDGFGVGAPGLTINLGTNPTVPIGGSLTGTVDIATEVTRPLTVAIVQAPGQPLDPNDPTPTGGVTISPSSVTFKPGETSKTITVSGGSVSTFVADVYVQVTDDQKDEDDEGMTVYDIDSISCDSAATNANLNSGVTIGTTTYNNNWAAVKAATGNVTVTAKLKPAGASGTVTWSGGTPVTGQPLEVTVPLTASTLTTLTATCGSDNQPLNLWVIWGSVSFVHSGDTQPTGSVALGPYDDGTTRLGPCYNSDKSKGWGKYVAEAKLTPTGVGAVIKSGLVLCRQRYTHDYINGVLASSSTGPDGTDDTSDPALQNDAPDANDTIYDSDGPSVFDVNNNSLSVAAYDNFQQWATWGGKVCTDKSDWLHFWGLWVATSSPQVTSLEVAPGQITLP